MGVSCDICKYGERHDYLDTFYCRNSQHYRCGDFPIVENCRYGELDKSAYHNKYHVPKNLDNVSKKLVRDGLAEIITGIKSKNIHTIVNEIMRLSDKIIVYREPNKCETCAKEYCEKYANGRSGCSKWE